MSRILLVEDDEPIRESMTELLSDEGYDVRCATNGEEAMSMLSKDDLPCLILLDLMMPKMDGFQFRKLQLSDGRLRSIPVVIMSAYGDINKNKRKLRVQAYLKKPVDIEEVLEIVHQWCALEPSPAQSN
jgi:CheY-like chemotaxis protein